MILETFIVAEVLHAYSVLSFQDHFRFGATTG